MLFNDTPRMIFNDASSMLQKRMAKQWRSTKLLKLVILSIPEVATSFTRWIFNLPIEKEQCSVKCAEVVRSSHYAQIILRRILPQIPLNHMPTSDNAD